MNYYIILFLISIGQTIIFAQKNIIKLSINNKVDTFKIKDMLNPANKDSIPFTPRQILNHNNFLVISDRIDKNIKIIKLKNVDSSYKSYIDNVIKIATHNPGKIVFNSQKEVYAINDFTTNTLQEYNNKFELLCEIVTPLPIFDFEYVGDYIYISVPALNEKSSSIYVYNIEGKLIESYKLKGIEANPFYNFVFIRYIEKTENIAIIWVLKNLIQIYNKNFDLLEEYCMPNLTNSINGNSKIIPRAKVFSDVYVEQNSGDIYILNDAYSKYPQREIFVFNPNNRMTNVLLMPEPIINYIVTMEKFILAITRDNYEIKIFHQ